VQHLDGKVAVVTGAASGIGLAVAGKAVAEGMKVVLADIEEGALEDAEQALVAAGGDVLAVVTDVSCADDMTGLRDRTIGHFGAVHLVHLNAGIGMGGLTWEVPAADWEWLLGVNLWGVVHGIRAFVPGLIEQGEGHVVNTASIAGLVAPGFMAPYNASKHAVVAISESLARDLRFVGSPVGVSVLCPGFVRTHIDDPDRLRPEWAPPAPADDATASLVREGFRQFVQGGIEAERVADAVIAAVKADRFYILTHPELDEVVGQRARDIEAGASPADVSIL
jgi:NAD(P)-dependent dehydrogenase (short-subunit alcohol dehydrogenase family)